MPSKWLRQRKKDQFHRLAKERGYRTRASFKLLEIAKRYRFIKKGDRVLDLGAAPGGWLQVARQIVEETGYVLGVDKEPIEQLPHPNVTAIIADISQNNAVERIQSESQLPFDVVIADLSPNVTGIWELDHARQIELARNALTITRAVMRPSGNMLTKVFQGSELKDFQKEMKACFKSLRNVKPPASRPESAELFLLGLTFIAGQSFDD